MRGSGWSNRSGRTVQGVLVGSEPAAKGHPWVASNCEPHACPHTCLHLAAVFPKMTTGSATTCSALSAVATGASLAAYFSESGAPGACEPIGTCGPVEDVL